MGTLLVRYLAQDDPPAGRDELAPSDSDGDSDDDDGDHNDESDEPAVVVPPGAFTIERLRREVAPGALANKTGTERKLARVDAFAAAEASPFSPPRMRIGDILIRLYDAGDPNGRAALLEAFATARLRWGVWKAAKAIYKRAEARHDAAMFGVLAYRFDTLGGDRDEIGLGTAIYLRRRAWRYLRLLGNASLDSYPTFAIEVLRHFPRDHRQHSTSWVAAHIFDHGSMRYSRSGSFALASDLARRGFAAAWKVSPAPLLRLLEVANNDTVATFAIQSLRGDHALSLRAVEPAWLARLGRRDVPAIDGFVVSLLRESPEFHQSKLRGLGLHDIVVGFLRSGSSDARSYALEYAAAHAPDIALDMLLELVTTSSNADVTKFASARLEAVPRLPADVLLRLLGVAAAPWALAKLAATSSPRDVTAAQFVEVAARGSEPYNQLVKFYNDAKVAVPAAHWTTLLDDPRFAQAWQLRSIVNLALGELAKRSARDIGIAWIQRSLEDRNRTDTVVRWLDAGMLTGPDLDVEWVKGLVGKPRLRPIALRLLGDRRRVEPARVGMSWLLELARSPEPELVQFANKMLLESFSPDDLGGERRLWELAAGAKSPETVRAFAATYLKAHHPELGPRTSEGRMYGITPKLTASAFALATVRPLLDDDRADVRRLAVAIAGEEVARWGDRELPYELAASQRSEPRALGAELLLNLIVEGDGVRRMPEAWLDGSRLFQLADAPHKASREVALTLIRRLYDRVGGAERLGWLMDATERDVRLFAVRLFWERHRPKPWPASYQPRKPTAGLVIGTARFTDLAALRTFVRVVLFGLPPGRVGARDPLVEGAPKPERALPASIAKRRLIETLRDAALDDRELAHAMLPVLREFTSSTAKGEWQASLQAITALHARHGELTEERAP